MKLGTHPIFDIDGLEWLEQMLRPKVSSAIAQSLKNNHSAKRLVETWEDRCACIGMIEHESARALCSILMWGFEQHQYDKIVNFLSMALYRQMKHDKIKMPNNCPHSPAELCEKMANMVLYLHLWNCWELYTVKGKLWCGEMFGWGEIQLHEKTYSNQMLKYQRFLINTLQELVVEIEDSIHKYRKNLKNV